MDRYLIMLVGLPMSGKSTFSNKFMYRDDAIRLSSDDLVMLVAKALQITYNEAWKISKPYLTNAFNDYVTEFFSGDHLHYKVVFWDQTNLSKKSRIEKLKKVPEGFKKIAIYFPERDNETLSEIKRIRKLEGKEIPNKDYNNIKKYEDYPDKDEGFDEVYGIKYIENNLNDIGLGD